MAWVQSQLCFLPPAAHPPPGQVVVCGDPQGEDTKEMLRCVRSVFSPNKVEVPLLPALPWSLLPSLLVLHPFSQFSYCTHPPLFRLSSGKHPVLFISEHSQQGHS